MERVVVLEDFGKNLGFIGRGVGKEVWEELLCWRVWEKIRDFRKRGGKERKNEREILLRCRERK